MKTNTVQTDITNDLAEDNRYKNWISDDNNGFLMKLFRSKLWKQIQKQAPGKFPYQHNWDWDGSQCLM